VRGTFKRGKGFPHPPTRVHERLGFFKGFIIYSKKEFSVNQGLRDACFKHSLHIYEKKGTFLKTRREKIRIERGVANIPLRWGLQRRGACLRGRKPLLLRAAIQGSLGRGRKGNLSLLGKKKRGYQRKLLHGECASAVWEKSADKGFRREKRVRYWGKTYLKGQRSKKAKSLSDQEEGAKYDILWTRTIPGKMCALLQFQKKK